MDARQIKGRVESESEDEKEERYAPISGRFSLMISSFFTIPFKYQQVRVQQRSLACPPDAERGEEDKICVSLAPGKKLWGENEP